MISCAVVQLYQYPLSVVCLYVQVLKHSSHLERHVCRQREVSRSKRGLGSPNEGTLYQSDATVPLHVHGPSHREINLLKTRDVII